MAQRQLNGRNLTLLVLLAPILMASGCEQSKIGDFDFPEGIQQHVVRADGIDWKPCPKHLPPGCEITIIEGNPQRPGLFTIRFRVGDTFVMPPHSHPRDERVTMLQGQFAVAFGTDASRQDATRFGPGDYYVNARGAVHTVWADSAAVIQITGMGPWEVHFVD